MSNLCPITGKPCCCPKLYNVVSIKNKKIEDIKICIDCLPNLETYDGESKIQDCCDFCGMTLDELLQHSKMGCSRCYEKFEKPFIFSLEKLQRIPNREKKEIKHVGSVPYLWKMQKAENTDPKKFLLELKQKLAISIRREKYKKSQDLKYKIIAFESFLKKIDEFKNDEQQVNLIKKQVYEFIYLFRESELKENGN